jgi:cyclophilin family peptidyl-prolyl cis-trans isomerase
VSEYEEIRDGETVESWMKDDAWERTIQKRKARYADMFFAATSEEQAVRVWRLAQVFGDVINEFDTVKNAGQVRKIKKAQEKKQK